MSRSSLSLVLILVGVGAISSAQPKPAPPPREPTTAELLVGRWRLVKFGEKEIPPTGTDILIFTTTGKYTSTNTRFGQAPETVSGSYRVIGRSVELSTLPPQPPATEQLPIHELTKTRLIIRHGEIVSFKRSEYVRDEVR